MVMPMSIPHGLAQISGPRGVQLGLSDALAFRADGRLAYSTATLLLYSPYNGNIIDACGEILTIDAAGMSLDVATNLIDATGADATIAMAAAATNYYVYVSNNAVAYAPAQLRASTTAPTMVRGTLRLGNGADDSPNWRFLGRVRTDATPNFIDTLAQRFIANYYNRLLIPLFACPAYNDNNTLTTYVHNSAAHAPLNAGVGASVEWLSNGEDVSDMRAQFQMGAVGTADFIGGLEVAAAIAGTNPVVAARLDILTADCTGTVAWSRILAAGYWTATLTGFTFTTNRTITADHARNGATIDPPATYLTGMIKA